MRADPLLPLPSGQEPTFPLQRQFRRHILPLLLGAVAVLVGLAAWTSLRLTESLYLEGARQYAIVVADRVKRDAPDAWQAIITHTPQKGMLEERHVQAIRRAVLSLLGEDRLERLKIFDRYGQTLFSSDPADIGTLEDNDVLRQVSRSGQPQVSLDGEDGSSDVYDSYVAITNADGRTEAVIELFEPADYVNPLLLRTVASAVIPPGLLLLGLVVLLARLVARAQAEIDTRTGALISLKQRLESLVSSHALGAVATADDGQVSSRVMDATLFYSDVVDFTGYSEDHPPQRVVDFLNHLMTVQVEVIQQYGGDVDKMIGDAVLAVFEGSDRAARAIACAQQILLRLAALPDLPRGIRIGIHDGYVIAGAIGPSHRRDFTVIGDSVNVTARLCGLGASGELVSDAPTVARAGHPDGFSGAEDQFVKGRSEPIRVRRWQADPPTAPAAAGGADAATTPPLMAYPRPSTSSIE